MDELFNVSTFEACLLADLPETDVMLTSDMPISDARALSLKQSILKKFVPSLFHKLPQTVVAKLDEPAKAAYEASKRAQKAHTDVLEQKTLELFEEMNRRCIDSFNVDVLDQREQLTLNIMRERLFRLTHDNDQVLKFSLCKSLEKGMTGPGAAVGDCDTSFYHKMFASDLASTNPRLQQHYEFYQRGSWHIAETVRSLTRGFKLVAGSSLAFAPKTATILRLISPQAILDMFYQKGTGACIEEVLETDLNINLSTQPDVNRYMAQQGSLNGSDATIDLKSASDSISCRFLRWVCAEDFYTFLDWQRAKFMTFPDNYQREPLKLEMFSTMGNGFTFPLQTLIFATLVESCYDVLGIKTERGRGAPRNYSVFGDDIIVRSDAYGFVCQMLERCGFIVNVTKSYNTGSFRESCGEDYFRGFNIRGVYLRKADSPAHIYSLINRLLRWSCRSGIMLPNTIAYLKGLVPHRPVPYHVSDSAGIKTPLNRYRGRKVDKNGASKYRCLEPVEQRISRGDESFTPAVLYNPSGLLIAAIGGFIRNGSETVRSNADSTRFRLGRPRVTPNWECGLPLGLTPREYEVVYDCHLS